MKLLFLNLFLIILISCGDIEDAQPRNMVIPKTYLSGRWNIERISQTPLQVYLAQDLIDILPIELEDQFGFNIIEQMADTWNQGHSELNIFELPFTSTENKNYTNLNDFQDDEMGVYPSYGWYQNLSKNSLAITQFFGKRITQENGDQYLELVHADIIINFRNYKYSIAGSDSNKFDLPTVILHEMGHMIGLPHPRGKYALGVMAATLGREEIKRNLSKDDLAALFMAYPLTKTKYFYDIPDLNAPLNLIIDPPIEKFIIELMEDGHLHYHHNGKYISCDKKIH